MSVNLWEEKDCTDRCKSTEHGKIICAALTKRAVSDVDLCAYLNSLCCRCENVKDDVGRTALHIAVSCGRLNVVKWLLQVKQACINSKDDESGYTPLHRSIFYGKIDIAVYLVKQGASTTTLDLNGLTGFEHAMKDSKATSLLHSVDKSEVYVWGSNTNYVFGAQHARSFPEILDVFHRDNPQVFIRQVCLEKFHCVLVANNGQVYSCGHGYGGRLGLSTEETILSPKLIKFTPRVKCDTLPVHCLKASISIDHSVFLTTSGHVWTCGLNTHCVLGIKPPPAQVLEPYQLRCFRSQIIGIGTGRYHTVAWDSENIFTWGLNGGQLGHDKNDGQYIIVPKMVSCLFKAQTISVNNCVTAVLTTHGNVYVFHDYLMIKITAKQLSLTAISVTGGRLNTKLNNSISEENNELRIVGLNKHGNLYIWQESSPNFLRCLFTINRSLNVYQTAININEILFVTQEGEAYSGTIKFSNKKKQMEDNIRNKKSSECENQVIKVTKVPNVHRAIFISSDSEGKNYAVLQVSPSAFLEIPKVSPSTMGDDLLKLYYAPENESLQNATIKICGRAFYLHKYIIAMGSSRFYKLINHSTNSVIEFSNIKPEAFEKILLSLYTPGYSLREINKLLEKAHILDEDIENMKVDKLLLVAAKEGELAAKDDCQKLVYNAYPDLYDVILKSKDNKLISVHGCVLIARSEYFYNSFSTRWNKSILDTQEIAMPFLYNTLILLIEYLYTDEVPLLSCTELDQVCNLLIAADHMCIYRLKEICECMLCTFVTLKNVGQMLNFAAMCYAKKLQVYCMEFVALNLAAVLETRALDFLNDIILRELSDYYCDYNPIMLYRIITPYSTAPSDEEVIAASKLHPVVFEDADEECLAKSPPKSQKRRSRQRKSSSSENNQLNKSISNENTEVEIVEPNLHTFHTNNIPLRIKAIVSAHDVINNDDVLVNYSKLVKSNPGPISMVEFPSLANSSPPKQSRSIKSTDKLDVKQKITKVSQRERKRLSSIVEPSIPDTPAPEIPKNPWKLVSEISSPVKSVAVQSIIVEEKKQKENFVKMKLKHLSHIQIEDRAIEDLIKFYNAENLDDEIITIGRIEIGAMASPQWIHRNRKS